MGDKNSTLSDIIKIFHASRKERIRIIIIIIKIIIRNVAKTISPPNFVWET
jgi:t-SNARE complex subunit (syntaxin)